MSGSNRVKRSEALAAISFCALAIFGTVILLYVLGVLNGREAERREQAPASYSEAAQADAQRACTGRQDGALFECVYERVKASQEQARGEQDLSAQQRAATAALAAAVLAFLTLAITGIGVWFVKRTLDATLDAVKDTGKATKAMLRQNELAEDTAKRQLRAYITLEIKKEAVIEGGKEIRINLAVKNYGQTPAVNAEFRFATAYNPANWIWPHAVDGNREKRAAITVHPGVPTNVTIAPENTLTHDQALEIIRGEKTFFARGVVYYEDVFGDEHVTQLSLEVRSQEMGAGRIRVSPNGNIAT